MRTRPLRAAPRGENYKALAGDDAKRERVGNYGGARAYVLQMSFKINVQLPPTRLAKAGLKYSERGHSSFLVADTDGLIHFIEEDFAVSDFPSGRVLDNGVD